MATQCRFIEDVCHKKGHIAKPSKPSTAAKKPVTTHNIQESAPMIDTHDLSPPMSSSPNDAYSMFTARIQVKPIAIPVKIQLLMELDNGASISIVSEATYHSFFGEDHSLEQSDTVLKTYIGQ